MSRVFLGWISGIAVVVGGWFVSAAVFGGTVLPGPVAACRALVLSHGTYVPAGLQTAVHAALGLAVASGGSALIVGSVGVWPGTDVLFYPYVTMLKASPAVAFVPVFVSLVGSGPACKILVSAMISFFPLVVGGIDGLGGVPDRLRIVATAWGAGRGRTFVVVSAPYALAGFATGLKTAGPLAVVGAIVGEYMAGGEPSGIGNILMARYAAFQMHQVFAGVIVATVLGMVFFAVAYLVAEALRRTLHLAR